MPKVKKVILALIYCNFQWKRRDYHNHTVLFEVNLLTEDKKCPTTLGDQTPLGPSRRLEDRYPLRKRTTVAAGTT